MLDQPVRLGLRRRRARRRRRRRSRTRTRARTTRSRARRRGRRSASAAAALRASPSGSATVGRRLRAAGEDLVELVVVEPGVRADAAAVEAGRAGRAGGVEPDLGGHREPVDPGHQAARLVRERAREHRLDHSRARRRWSCAGTPRRRAPSPGRTWAETSAMWIQRRTPSPSGCGGDGVVEVARGRGVDRERPRGRAGRGGSGSTSAAPGIASRASSSSRRGKPRRSSPSQRSASTTSRARFGEPSSRVTRTPRELGLRERPSARASARTLPRASGMLAAALEQRLDHVEAPARRRCPPRRARLAAPPARPDSGRSRQLGRRGRRERLVERLVADRVFEVVHGRTSGLMPLSASETSSEVRYSPIVRSMRTAVGQLDRPPGTSPCRTSARRRSSPGRSRDDRRGEDLGGGRGVPVDQDHGRARVERVSGRVVDLLALGAGCGW